MGGTPRDLFWPWWARFLGPRTVGWFVLGMAAGLLSGVAELAVAFSAQVFLASLGLLTVSAPGRWAVAAQRLSVPQACALLIAIGAARALASFIALYSARSARETMNARLRLLALHEMLLGSKGEFVATSETNFRLAEVFPKASDFCYLATALLSSGILTATVFASMVSVAPREAVIATLSLGVVGAVLLSSGRAVRRESTLIVGEQLAVSQAVERVGRNWLFIKIMRTGAQEFGRLRDRTLAYEKHSARVARHAIASNVVTQWTSIVMLVGLVVVGRGLLHTPAGPLLSFLYLFMRFAQGVGAATSNASALNSLRPQFGIALDYLETRPAEDIARALGQPPVAALPRPPAGGVAADEVTHGPRIELVDIDFGFAPVRPLFESLSLSIAADQSFGFVGASGSGKTTLLGIILGVLTPQKGTVTIDGTSPEAYLADDRHRIGYVAAEPFLIQGTVRENICYGLRSEHTDAEIAEAMKLAALTDFDGATGRGLDFQIGENGAGLSAGQRQRLALARALLQRPQLLILDEPSANLDEATEAALVDNLRVLPFSTTCLIVSHREPMLRHCHAVYDLGARKLRAVPEK